MLLKISIKFRDTLVYAKCLLLTWYKLSEETLPLLESTMVLDAPCIISSQPKMISLCVSTSSVQTNTPYRMNIFLSEFHARWDLKRQKLEISQFVIFTFGRSIFFSIRNLWKKTLLWHVHAHFHRTIVNFITYTWVVFSTEKMNLIK